MSSASTRGIIGRGGHELQQWLKDPALPQTWFTKTVQEGWGISNGNDAEPCPPDVKRSVRLRMVPVHSQISRRAIAYCQK